MTGKVIKLVTFIVFGWLLAVHVLAADLISSKHIDMAPHAETVTSILKGFPAPSGALCLSSICMGAAPTPVGAETAVSRTAEMSLLATSGTCSNSSGHVVAVPYDLTGDCTSDILWMNDQTHQFGWWLVYPTEEPRGTLSKWISQVVSVTPGYWIAASGDFNGDGKADLIWTSNNRDLYMWTNNNGSGFTSTYIGTYPDGWTLVGAADMNGDGVDDLIWENQNNCEYGYWLMNGTQVINRTTISVTCGYHIKFIETAFDSPNGTTPAIYWQGPANENGISPYYQWLPQGQTPNASFYGYAPSNWSFVSGSRPYASSIGIFFSLDVFYGSVTGGVTGLWWCANSLAGGESGNTSFMPGYQVVASGHYTGPFGIDNDSEDILWMDAAGDLVVWPEDGSQMAGSVFDGDYLGKTGFSLGTAPAGWRVVRPGVQN